MERATFALDPPDMRVDHLDPGLSSPALAAAHAALRSEGGRGGAQDLNGLARAAEQQQGEFDAAAAGGLLEFKICDDEALEEACDAEARFEFEEQDQEPSEGDESLTAHRSSPKQRRKLAARMRAATGPPPWRRTCARKCNSGLPST